MLPPACSEADTWLNNPAVRQALHAAPKEMTGPWQLCSTRIHYRSDGGSMLPIHDQLVRKEGEYLKTRRHKHCVAATSVVCFSLQHTTPAGVGVQVAQLPCTAYHALVECEGGRHFQLEIRVIVVQPHQPLLVNDSPFGSVTDA